MTLQNAGHGGKKLDCPAGPANISGTDGRSALVIIELNIGDPKNV